MQRGTPTPEPALRSAPGEPGSVLSTIEEAIADIREGKQNMAISN